MGIFRTFKSTHFGPVKLEKLVQGESRQVRRRKLRALAFAEITKQYPGEDRRRRRAIAFDRERNERRVRRELQGRVI
jgi:hypothetical protein